MLAESPLEHIGHYLEPWVSFLVLPVFAFANAGVRIGGTAAVTPLRPSLLWPSLLCLQQCDARPGVTALCRGTLKDWQQQSDDQWPAARTNGGLQGRFHVRASPAA